MKLDVTGKKLERELDIESTAVSIAMTQKQDGEIPWYSGQKTDPWDHVEAAMGLGIGGYLSRACLAYEWLAQKQNADGSWFSAYRQGQAEDKTRDANLSSYIAVGVFQYYLITGDKAFLKSMWPTISAAIDFALSLQSRHGDVYWAISPEGNVDRMALLTGSSSIALSVRCALAIARIIDCCRPAWQQGLAKLENAIVNKPHRFNMTKSRYSMDWFYPILGGLYTGQAARKRLDRYWRKYVIDGQGVRCVLDAPWITIAETSELSLALSAIGNRSLAEIVFHWISDKKFDDGSYWAGFTFPDMTIWPEDKLTWTNAVVLMAADALYDLTPASRLFSHRFWQESDLLSR